MTTFAHAVFPYLARLYEPLRWGFWGVLGIFVLDGIADPLVAALINRDQTWTWDPVVLSFLLEWMPAFAGAGAALLATWGLAWWAHRHEIGRSAFRTAKPARLLSSPNEIAFAKAFQKEGSETGAPEEASSKLRPWENEYVPLPLLPYNVAKRNGAGMPPETGDATGGPASHLPASLNGAGLADSAGFPDGAGLGDADLADLIGKNQNVLLIGSPTAGKTRKVFEVLRRQVPDREVIVPHQGDALRSGLTPEARQYLRRKAVVVVVDDLHKYAGRGDTLNLLLEQVAAAADSCAIVGTCRDGPELEIARGGHDGASVQGLHISEVYKRFYAHRYVIQRLTDEEIDRIAEGAGKDPSSVDRSDCATPGDILLQQNKKDMRARFEDRLSRGEQHVLHAGQLLDAGQVEPTRERIQWVVASLYDRPRSVATGGALQDTLRQLEEMRFLSSTSPIVLEPAYTRLDVGPGRIVAPYAPGRQVGEDLVALISLLSKRNDAEGLVGLGIGLREREKTEKALECLNRAVDIDRSNARAWFYRGFLLHDLGRPSEEIFDSFDRAVEADPSCAVAWFNRGTVLDRLGRPDEALESFDRAVEADPSFAKAWSNRGIVLKELGRPDEALDSYDQAVEADPSFAKAWHNRGIVLSDLGRSDEALDSFDRAVEADPSFVEAWYGRGVVLKELGRPDEALDSYDRAVEADPSHAKAWYRRGVVLKELGRPDEALDSYDQAVEADPSDAKAWHNRGIVLYDLGRLDEARTSYDRACELDPDLCN